MIKLPKFRVNVQTILELEYGSLSGDEAARIAEVLKNTGAKFRFFRRTTLETKNGTAIISGNSLIMDNQTYQVMFRGP